MRWHKDAWLAMVLLLVPGLLAGSPQGASIAPAAPAMRVHLDNGTLRGDFEYSLVVGTFYEWNTDPTAVPGLMNEVTARTGIRATVHSTPISLDEERIGRNPFLIMTGNRFFHLTDAETATLHNYLKGGGFLYADDCGGADLSFRLTITNLLPEATFVELSDTNPVFHAFYALAGTPKILDLYHGPARAYGAFLGNRLAVLYTYDTDVPCGWERNPDGSFVHLMDAAKHEAAYRMGVNVVMYALRQRCDGTNARPIPESTGPANPPVVWGSPVGEPARTYRMERRLPYNQILAIVPAGQTVWFAGRRNLPGEQDGIARYDYETDSWKVLTDSEGVLADEINCLAADHDGLWIGTSTARWHWNQGLWRYDFATQLSTRHTVEEGLVDNDVYALACDGDELWAATRSGLAHWNRRTHAWTDDPSHSSSYRDTTCCLAVDAHDVWYGRTTGLRRYDKQQGVFTQYDASNSPIDGMVNALVKDGPRLWISAPPHLFAFCNGAFSEPVETREIAAADVLCCAADGDMLCLGTRNGGLRVREGATGVWRAWDEASGLPSRCISAVAVDSRSIWCAFGAGPLGVGRFDRHARIWSFSGHRAGIPCDHLYALHSDGNMLYVGTMGNGFWAYDIGRDHWINLETGYRAEEALSVRSDIYAIQQEGASIWFGTNLGLCRHEAGTDTYETIEGTTAAVAALAGYEGLMLCGTRQSGLLAFDPRRRTWSDWGRCYRIPSGAVTALATKGPEVWIGRDTGLSLLDYHAGRLLNLPPEMANTPVTALLVQHGVAWIGTPDGLFAFRAGQQHPVHYGRDANLPDRFITSLLSNANGVLIGTRGGLALLPTGAEKAVPESQLRAHLVNALADDAKNLWVATLGQGLVRFGKTPDPDANAARR